MSIEHIKDGEETLAIIIRGSLSEPGLHFVTPNDYNLQLGVHIRPAGESIPPHVHKEIKGLLNIPIQEFLYVERGRIKIDLYGNDDKYHSTAELGPNDAILLLKGHGIEFMEEVKLVEIKQGPYYSKEQDKRPLKGDGK